MTLLVIYLAIAIGISFLCSILEAVLLSVTPSYVQKLQNEKPEASKHLVNVKNRIDQSLSSILILNTFAHTMGAAGVGAQATQIFGPQWETLIAIVLTLVILYFSEIIPKTLGATFWQQLALPSAFIINLLIKLVYPLVWLSTHITKLFSKNKENEITREEIIALASLGHKEGILFPQENQYLKNLLDLRNISTEDILTPRTVVHRLEQSITVDEALSHQKTRDFSRIPVFDSNDENIVGKVFLVDLLEASHDGKGSQKLETFINPIHRVSDKLPVQQLLDTFLKKQAHQFLVEDEFGQMMGIVTLEDAIETLLGTEIIDERDKVTDMQAFAKKMFRDRLRKNKQG